MGLSDGGGWRKSSFSNGSGGSNCVEVAPVDGGEGGVAVRDSKFPDGHILYFTVEEWDAFVAGVKSGEFER